MVLQSLVFPCRFCYFGSSDIDPDIAVHTLSAAGKYMVPALEEPCRQIVIDELTLETIWEAYTYSVSFGDEGLREGCHDFLRRDVTLVEEALVLPSFLKIPHRVLLDFLQMNDTNVDLPWDEDKLGILVLEKDLFVACNLWAAAECKRQSIEVSGPNKRKVLGDCLFLIRFPSLDNSDIVNTVEPTGILNQEEKEGLLAGGDNQVQQRFLSTKQRFPLMVIDKMAERLRQTIWKFHVAEGAPPKRRLLRSTLQFIPRRRVVLSQIWLVPRYYICIPFTTGPQCSKYEVLIKSKSKIRSKQSVVSQSILLGDETKVLLLDLEEPLVLDVDCPHTIKVHDKGWDDSDPQVDVSKEAFAHLVSKLHDPEDIELEVSYEESNEWIGGVTLSLL